MITVNFQTIGREISIHHFNYGLFREFKLHHLSFDLEHTKQVQVTADVQAETSLCNLLSQ